VRETRAEVAGRIDGITGVPPSDSPMAKTSNPTGIGPHRAQPDGDRLPAPAPDGSVAVTSVIRKTGQDEQEGAERLAEKGLRRWRIFGAVQKQASLALPSSEALKCSR